MHENFTGLHVMIQHNQVLFPVPETDERYHNALYPWYPIYVPRKAPMDEDPTGSSRYNSDDSKSGEERFMRWKDWQELEQEQDTRMARIRSSIEAVFSEGLMIALSLLLIPVIIIPFLIHVPPEGQLVLNTIDGAILAIFILEYVFKLALAEDRRQFFLNPWHILDLFVIAAPIAALIAGSYQMVAGSLRLLRLLRLTRTAALGTRAYSRRGAGSEMNASAPGNRPRSAQSGLSTLPSRKAKAGGPHGNYAIFPGCRKYYPG